MVLATKGPLDDNGVDRSASTRMLWDGRPPFTVFVASKILGSAGGKLWCTCS